jgi:hypothetical protein
MGQLTRKQIVDQALAEIGYDSTYQTLANVALNISLKAIYESWPWPFLQRNISGVALGSGVTSLPFGVGAGGVSNVVQKVRDPLFLYRTDRTVAGRARVRQFIGNDPSMEPGVFDPLSVRGLPTAFRIEADPLVYGKWHLIPYPVPDRDYLLKINYTETPAIISSASIDDGVVPLYPNDDTLQQIVKAWALGHQNDKAGQTEAESKLSIMKINDRVKYGTVEGINDILGLDPSVFR